MKKLIVALFVILMAPALLLFGGVIISFVLGMLSVILTAGLVILVSLLPVIIVGAIAALGALGLVKIIEAFD